MSAEARLAAATALHEAVHSRPELHRGRAHLTTILTFTVIRNGGDYRDVLWVLEQKPAELAGLHVGEVASAWLGYGGRLTEKETA